MSVEELKNRFKRFAIEVATLIKDLPRDTVNNAYCNQLIRCSSSTAANYRAACRAKSSADFINKLKIVEEEMDESVFFLEMLQHFNHDLDESFEKNIKEANELLSITVASIRTSKANRHS